MTNLDKEYTFFKKNQKELLKRYIGKYIVIKGEKVLNSYISEAEAYSETVKDNKLGTFLIQMCLPEEKLPPQVFYSRVVF